MRVSEAGQLLMEHQHQHDRRGGGEEGAAQAGRLGGVRHAGLRRAAAPPHRALHVRAWGGTAVRFAAVPPHGGITSPTDGVGGGKGGWTMKLVRVGLLRSGTLLAYYTKVESIVASTDATKQRACGEFLRTAFSG